MGHAPAPLILIADDEMDLRAMLRILLERDGYRILEARNGEEAVAVCRQQLPDVVLLDILMPVMDGAAACAHIQALPDGDRVPVLMITALNDKQSIDRCFDAGATDYLTKPINNQVLRRRVRRLLRTRQAEEALRANEARLSSIVHTATDAIVLTDNERCISLFNAAAERMFGWHAAEINGGTLEQLIPSVASSACAELLQAGHPITNTAPGEYLQCSGRRRDGTEFPIEVSLGCFEQNGQPMLTVTIRDITRRKLAEAEVERRVQQLASLAQIGQAVTTRLDLDEVLKTVIDQVMLRLEAEGVSALLLENPAELVFASVNGASADKLRGVRIPATVGFAGEVLRTGQALRIRSAEDRERIYRDVENVSQYHALDIVAVPLKLGSEILGVMEAVHSRPYTFTDDDLRLLESAGSWAAIAIGNARQHQRLQRRLRESEAMAAIGRALNETLDLDHVLQLIATSTRQIIPKASLATILLADEVRQTLYAVTGDGRVERLLGNWRDDVGQNSLAARVVAEQIVSITDVQQLNVPWPELLMPDTQSLLIALVNSGAQRFGAIAVQSAQLHAFDSDDERLLTMLGVEAAIAIQNARLYQSEHLQRELAEALRDTAAAIIGSIDLDDVLDRVLDNVGRVVPHDAANIMLADAGVARVVRWRGYDHAAHDQLQARRFSVADTLPLRQMSESHQPVAIAQTGGYSGWVTLPGSRAVQSFLGASIRFNRRLLGFINLESGTGDFFKAEHADRLQAFANQAAVALENARLYQLEQEEYQRVQQMQAAAMQSEKMEALERLATSLVRAIEQPLHAMRHDLQQAKDAERGAADYERHLQNVSREIERLNQIARSVVSFAQPEREARSETQVSELIRQATAQARDLLDQYHIQVTSDLAAAPSVLVAPQQMTQVFFYLIENAVEATGERGQLHIVTQVNDQHVLAMFIDDGPSISHEDMPHIFEPFYTTKQHGTGLGLAISHNVVQQQGGALTVENVTKGRGVMFVVKLPLAQASGA
jgi:PAS domain S-box-containing protein